MRAKTILLCSTMLVGSACAKTTVVGVSTEPEPPKAEVRDARPSLILGGEDELLVPRIPRKLGDLDGDGYDDFFLLAEERQQPESDSEQRFRLYLFYGRPDFPDQLATVDASAVFRTSTFEVSPLGDFNGDGLADFAMADPEAQVIAIVLGSPNRLAGTYDKPVSDVIWRGPAERTAPSHQAAPNDAPLSQPFLQGIYAAGDTNCDGIDDVILFTESGWHASEDNSIVQSLDHRLILGRSSLPNGRWDPSWQAAVFATEEEDIVSGYEVTAAGDLNADGCGDLVAYLESELHVFYGGPDRLSGRLTKRNAGAALRYEPGWVAMLGDLDGDHAIDLVRMPTPAGDPTFKVMYGSTLPLSGELQFTATLTLAFDSESFVTADSGDISGDGIPDLVIADRMYAASAEARASRGAMFAVFGTGERMSGNYEVTEADLLMMGPEPASTPPDQSFFGGLGSSMIVAGDIDGDGANEILSAAPSAHDSGAVFLIPSAPRAPD